MDMVWKCNWAGFIALVATVASVGCSAVARRADDMAQDLRSFTEPAQSAAHARLRVVTNGTVKLVPAEPGTTCHPTTSSRAGVAVSGAGFSNSGLRDQSRGMAGAVPTQLAKGEMRVDVNVPLYVSVAGGWSDRGMNYECAAMGGFVAIEGAQYELRAIVDKVNKQCRLLLQQIAPTTEIIKLQPLNNCSG